MHLRGSCVIVLKYLYFFNEINSSEALFKGRHFPAGGVCRVRRLIECSAFRFTPGSSWLHFNSPLKYLSDRPSWLGVPPPTLRGTLGAHLAWLQLPQHSGLLCTSFLAVFDSFCMCSTCAYTYVLVCVYSGTLTASLSRVQLCIPGIAGVVDETVACNINAAFHCGWCKSLGQAALVFQSEPRTNSQPETHRLGINRAGVRDKSGAAGNVKGGGGDK